MANINGFGRTSVSITVLPPRSSSWSSSSSMVTVQTLSSVKNRNSPQQPPPIDQVKLAEEDAASNCDSDHSSFYDSVNEIETDSAKDETDLSEGYESNAEFEYEVDELSESEDIESHDTSSGTDTDGHSRVISANTSTESDTTDTTETETNEKLEILAQDADLEESDGPIDQELERAEFPVCSKCKCAKANSLYRYCTKCYQIRRTHFPPRPKRRRKRSSLAQRNNGRIGLNSWSISKQNARKEHKLAIGDDEDGRMSRNSSCDGAHQMAGQLLQRSQSQQHQSSSLQKHHSHQHSAGESSCCSSQEIPMDLDESFSVAAVTSVTSQSTFGSDEIDRLFNHVNGASMRSNSNLYDGNYPSSPESVYPNSTMTSCNSSFTLGTDSGILTKADSGASTVSAFTISSLSQSSQESNSQGSLVMSNSSISSVLCDSSVTTTTTSAIDTMTNASPSVAPIKRTASHTVTSTQMLTKRKFDSSDGNNNGANEVNGDDGDAESMAKRAKYSMDDETEEQPDGLTANGKCIMCLARSKNGAFVHNHLLHVCCCYKCAVKIWNKKKRCPICNMPVKTILKIFVH